MLGVAPSAYYAWQRRQPPVPESAWQVAVRKAFAWHSVHNGTLRLRAELHAQFHRVGCWRIQRTLAYGISSLPQGNYIFQNGQFIKQ